ncbi:mercuric transport protein MerTP [Phaeocystidibacter luteus]|uniref:Mercuric transport protein MerT n=1 Tax=Phaeocystidibacter luteus TaxID=911197 RepID=A0A6N6RF45_9FLAO|nr:mercuric transport protein MerTP [Phaeocystidibacter luteus]KAB2807689.1 mercuric transport protein MerTP [Phaeocystidibacter luteus]
MKKKNSRAFAFTGLLTAITASLCCITPVLALMAGSSGLAATFSWLEPYRRWLIGLSALTLVFAWYQKLKPRSAEEIACECEEDAKPSFWQSKKFLGIISVFALLMMAFPYYSTSFYPEPTISPAQTAQNESSYEINISGMTCSGCEEHVKMEVGSLPGISGLEVSYEKGSALVSFDKELTNLEEVKEAVKKTGYTVESVKQSR